jgi:hypothetical protein
VDTSVSVGVAYEYAITKSPEPAWPVSGYILAGIKAPLVDSRGKILLLVDNTFSTSLQPELDRLRQDLAGDGWTVLRYDVSRTATPSQIKSIILSGYNSDPDAVKSVFLFGHVPVPYSGNYNADDHADHTGAWVADTFYGDLDGNWTDSTVHNTSATRSANRNVPGDGKFDQSEIPSDIDLEIGRVDCANMPAFSPKTELDLLRQYLNKDHNYRHGITTLPRRALIFDGFGESDGEAYAASGWRNFAPFFGSSQITEIGTNKFFSTAGSQGFLWSYIASGGDPDYTDCYFLGSTSDFASTDVRSAFLMVFGSYFGDWDATNDFLRAPLCTSTYCLATMWAGRPHWFLHPMALGETLGFCTRLTQNNSGIYEPTNFSREVHISLLGDPTLRMHVVKPPSNFSATTQNGFVKLFWSASPDSNLQGYHVYRSLWPLGPFDRLTTNVITETNFTDVVPGGGAFTYLVRAVKLESSSSGTYFNASQGIFLSTNFPPASSAPVSISMPQLTGNSFTFRCDGETGEKFTIESSSNLLDWEPLETNIFSSDTTLNFTDSIAPREIEFYRTRVVH